MTKEGVLKEDWNVYYMCFPFLAPLSLALSSFLPPAVPTTHFVGQYRLVTGAWSCRGCHKSLAWIQHVEYTRPQTNKLKIICLLRAGQTLLRASESAAQSTGTRPDQDPGIRIIILHLSQARYVRCIQGARWPHPSLQKLAASLRGGSFPMAPPWRFHFTRSLGTWKHGS